MLAAVSDPNHPEHDEYTDWLGGRFDPEALDLEAVNRRLSSPATYRAWGDEE